MSDSEMFVGGQEKFGSEFGQNGANVAGQTQQGGANNVEVEYVMASGLGSRGGPNKESNKFRSSPESYISL